MLDVEPEKPPSKDAFAQQLQNQQGGSKAAKASVSSKGQKSAPASEWGSKNMAASGEGSKHMAASGEGVKRDAENDRKALVRQWLPYCSQTIKGAYLSFGLTDTVWKAVLRERERAQGILPHTAPSGAASNLQSVKEGLDPVTLDTSGAKERQVQQRSRERTRERDSSGQRFSGERAKGQSSQAGDAAEQRFSGQRAKGRLSQAGDADEQRFSGERAKGQSSQAGDAAEQRRLAEIQRGRRNKEKQADQATDQEVSRDAKVLLGNISQEAFHDCLKIFREEAETYLQKFETAANAVPRFVNFDLDTDFSRFVLNMESRYEHLPAEWQTYRGFITLDANGIEEHYISYAFPTDGRSKFAKNKVLLTEGDVRMIMFRPLLATRVLDMLKFVLDFIGIEFQTGLASDAAFHGRFSLSDTRKFQRIFPNNHWVMRLTRILRFTKLLFPGTAYQFYQFLVEQAIATPAEDSLATALTQTYWHRAVFAPSPFRV